VVPDAGFPRNTFGDAGAATLSAAIRIVNQEKEPPVFDELDLCACGITDAAAEKHSPSLSKVGKGVRGTWNSATSTFQMKS
jgi:hypothetical protein